MPQNSNHPQVDELIRAAVYRELNSVEAPPAEEAWQRFQSRRAAATPAPAHRFHPWRRYSALAAALLLFIFGGYGIFRTLTGDGFYRNFSIGLAERDSADALIAASPAEGEGEESIDYGAPFSFDGWQPLQRSGESDLQPPGNLDGYAQVAAYTREAQSGITYHAALYTREESALLWVQAAGVTQDRFLKDLEQLLQMPFSVAAHTESADRSTPGNGPYLVWEKDGSRYLLWELEGSGDVTGLQRLIP